MNEVITTILTGITAFTATNIDDILILMLFFAQVNSTRLYRSILVGQYLGFSVLLLASLPGFFSRYLISPDWVKGLGLIPIVIGLYELFKSDSNNSSLLEGNQLSQNPSTLSRYLSPLTVTVAGITIANGSDNIGVYLPLFARSEWQDLFLLLGLFLLMVGLWYYLALKLSHSTFVNQVLADSDYPLSSCVLVALGVFIIHENISLTVFVFGISYFWLSQTHSSKEIATQSKKI
jgi:cadmium resistance protein CadD (predicted permease)